MRNLAIMVALAAITCLGIAATVSASTRTAKSAAACDAKGSCATMSAADCPPCPACPAGGSCDMAGTKATK